jgi:hypothetical protein
MRGLNITTLDASQWYDRDVLLHAAFQILVDFVEKEEPERITDFEHDEEQRRVWAEIQFLYRCSSRGNSKDTSTVFTMSAPNRLRAGLLAGPFPIEIRQPYRLHSKRLVSL